MRNIFLDCGSHLGEGLGIFLEKKFISPDFEIFMFEPNPACNIEQCISDLYSDLNITLSRSAVWTEDGTAEFLQENHVTSKSNSPIIGSTSELDGWGSGINIEGFVFKGRDTLVNVNTINFSKFLKDNFSEKDYIVCKLDIEGSEYKVLRMLLQDGTINMIDKLYVEFHHRLMKGVESKETTLSLIDQITSLGIPVEEWWF